MGFPVISDSLNVYLTQIEQFPILKPDEEYRLAVRYYRYKDIEAAHKLVTSNLRFVVKIALEYRYYGARLMDLVQEGNIGLMIAVKKFNPYKGYRLISYAVWWIKAYIRNFIIKTWSIVKMGTTQAQRRLFFKLNQMRKTPFKIKEESKRLAKKLDVQEDQLLEMEMRMSHRDFSLDAELDEESHLTHLELLRDEGASQEEALVKKEESHLMRREINSALQKLNPKEMYIVRNRLMADEPITLQEIGNRLGISRERVRQLEDRALRKLRENLIQSQGCLEKFWGTPE